MSIFDIFGGVIERFASRKTGGERISNEITTVKVGMGRTRRPDADQKTLTDEGYRRNVIIHACINIIANTVAEVDVYAVDSNTREPLDDKHPLNELLWMPDKGRTSSNQLLREIVIYLKATGNAYIHKGRARKGVVRLRALRPDRIQAMPDKTTGEIEAYEYTVEGSGKPQVIPREDIVHVKLFDPLDDYYGLSPMTVAKKFADLDSEAALYMRDFFGNGAMPAGLLKIKAKTTPKQRQDAREQWQETYGRGTRGRDLSNWFNIGVIDQDVDWQAMGQGPAEMRLDGIWNISESRLCASYGVPPILVQSKLGLERGTYSNYMQARRQFWEETLIPLYGHIGDTLTAQLALDFEEEAEIVFDTSKVAALQESETEKATRNSGLYQAGIISRNEAREATGHDEGDVDVLILPPGAIDASMLKEKLSATAAAQPPAPGEAPGEAPPTEEPAKPSEGDSGDEDGGEVPPDQVEEPEQNGLPVVKFERFLRERTRERAAR